MKRFWRGALAPIVGIAVLLGGCGGSNMPTNNATPIISNLFPSNITAGSAGFTVNITAETGLISSAKGATFAYWNGSARSSTFNLVTNQLQVMIPASDVAIPGPVLVTLWNPPPGGGMSQAPVSFAIVPPVNNGPLISSLSPPDTKSGGAGFMLTVNGTNFVAGDVITWNGVPQTTRISGDQATTSIPATYITNPGSASIAINTGGTSASPSVEFDITGPNNPSPKASGLSPSSLPVGSPDTEIVIKGSGFTASSVAEWNAMPLATAYISGSTIIALIPSADTAASGTAQITVTNPAPGGGTSSQVAFTVSSS